MPIAIRVESARDTLQKVSDVKDVIHRELKDITGGSTASRIITCSRPARTNEMRICVSFNGDSGFSPVYLEEGFASIDYRIIGLLYKHTEEVAVIFQREPGREVYAKTGVISYDDLPEKAESGSSSSCDELSRLDVLKLVMRALPGKRTQREMALMLGTLRKGVNGDAVSE